jgi:hypothetical protein
MLQTPDRTGPGSGAASGPGQRLPMLRRTLPAEAPRVEVPLADWQALMRLVERAARRLDRIEARLATIEAAPVEVFAVDPMRDAFPPGAAGDAEFARAVLHFVATCEGVSALRLASTSHRAGGLSALRETVVMRCFDAGLSAAAIGRAMGWGRDYCEGTVARASARRRREGGAA